MAKTETELVDQLKDWYAGTTSFEGFGKWRNRAAKAMRFYDGTGQWTDAARRMLESQGKPALTINRVMPIVNVIWGQQIKNRTEIKLDARKRGTKSIAKIGSALIKHAMDNCNGYDAVSDAFRDGAITGKGWLYVDLVDDRDPSGEMRLEAPNPLAMYEDPRNVSYDVNDGEFVFRERFVTKAELEARYPKQAKEALAAMHNDWRAEELESEGDEAESFLRFMLKLYGGDSLTSSIRGMEGAIVRECWYRTWERVKNVSVSNGNMSIFGAVYGEQDERALSDYLALNPNSRVERTERVITELHLAVTVGDVLLDHRDDPLHGMKLFPCVRFSPYWMHGDSFGVVDNLIGPQEEHNKMRSVALHLLNQAGNPGWIANDATPEGERQVREYGSTPGVLLKRKNFDGAIDRLKPEGLSQGHMQLALASAADMRDISGANPDIQGTQTEQSESGRARLIRQEAGLTTLAPIVGNLYRSQAILGDTLWEFIRHNDIYPPEEIEAIVDEEGIAEVGGMPNLVILMNRWDVGNYGVTTSPAKTTTAYRDAEIGELQELTNILRAMGLQLPPEVANALLVELLALSSFPGSSKIADMLKQRPALPMMQGGQGAPPALEQLPQPAAVGM